MVMTILSAAKRFSLKGVIFNGSYSIVIPNLSLVGLPSGHLISMPKMFLDPMRTLESTDYSR